MEATFIIMETPLLVITLLYSLILLSRFNNMNNHGVCVDVWVRVVMAKWLACPPLMRYFVGSSLGRVIPEIIAKIVPTVSLLRKAVMRVGSAARLCKKVG